MIEFAHPNTHKSFHIGHLRNIITGEAIARILINAGAKVIRANYQGDVGMHIAKCLYGVRKLESEFKSVKNKPITDKVTFLSQAYVFGSKAYEEDESKQAEIKQINQQIYQKAGSLKSIYNLTRKWSLTYFDLIYERLDVKFDRLYFESEVFKRGKEIVLSQLEKGTFKKSQAAIIFPGEKYGLHSRVFITQEGTATYEAKDLALAELQFKEYQPEEIIHVVAPEQTDYFKVVFKALEFILPASKDKEKHLQYGWVRLKKGKMSSRLGNVVEARWLLDEIKKALAGLVSDEIKLSADTPEKISQAAVKYAFLKTELKTTINFDIKESISLSGDSGPYLLYTYARIKSIFRKLGKRIKKQTADWSNLNGPEKQLILQLALFPEICQQAARNLEPGEVSKYLFDLTQKFNHYYHLTPILKSEPGVREARLALSKATLQVIENGLYLLGIKTVDKM